MELIYDGKYPNLCSGDLSIEIDGEKWLFPPGSLQSGGYVHFDDEWEETIGQGEWTIEEWPEGFPEEEEEKEKALEMINKQITHGCCGGCV